MRERGLVALGWTAALTVAAIVLVLAACGGGVPTALPTATIAASPSPGATLTPEQSALLGQFPDLKNEGEALATLVSRKELNADEIRAAITSDPQFAETEALGLKAGFGPAGGGVEFQYDNGVTVTTALMTSPDMGIALAARETGLQPAYAVLHLSPDGQTLTVYHADSTITLDLEAMEGNAVDTPEAEHSCRVGHCIYAAVVYLFQTPVFGTVLKIACAACVGAIAALPATLTVSAVVAIPACIACFPALAAMGIAAVVDCGIDPCDYCADDSCGESETYDQCSDFNAPPDPTTGSRAGVNRIRTGYRCEGVTTSMFPPSVDYSATQCTYGSQLVELVRACPLGCASPAPGESASRDCNTSATCVQDADCPAAQVLSQTCANNAYGGEVTYQVKYYDCRGGLCVSHQYPNTFQCTPVGSTPVLCAADKQSCEGEPVGDVRCVARASDGKSVEERDYSYWTCALAPQGWSLDCGQTTASKLVRECPGECLTDGSACAPTCDPAICTGDSLSGYPSCTYNYIQYILEQTVESKSCQPQSSGGETCVTTSQSRLKDTCPYGCTADRQDCAPPSAVPRAPGEFLMVGVPTADTLRFTWKDNSDNEQGFRIYHGARFAMSPRPSYLIQTVAANTTQVDVTYERVGDYCFEVYAYNDAGESAPAYYCTGF